MQLGQESLLEATYQKAEHFKTDAMRDVTFSLTIASSKEKAIVDIPYLTAQEIEHRYTTALGKDTQAIFNDVLKRLWVFIFGFPEESQIEQKFQALTEIVSEDVMNGVNPKVQEHKDLFFPKMTFRTNQEFESVVVWIINAFTKAKLKDLSLFEFMELPIPVSRFLEQVHRKDRKKHEQWLEEVKELLASYHKAFADVEAQRKVYNGQVEKFIDLLGDNLAYTFLDDKQQAVMGPKLKANEDELNLPEIPEKSESKKDKKFLRDFREDFPNYILVHDHVAAYLEKVYGYGTNADVYRTPLASTSRAVAHYVTRIIINANPIRRFDKGIHEVLAFDRNIIDEVFAGFLSRDENSDLTALILNTPCAKLTANLNAVLSRRNLEVIPPSQITDQMVVVASFKKCQRGAKLEKQGSTSSISTPLNSSRSNSSEGSPSQTPRSAGSSPAVTPRLSSSSSGFLRKMPVVKKLFNKKGKDSEETQLDDSAKNASP
jgi:hypothetical protein